LLSTDNLHDSGLVTYLHHVHVLYTEDYLATAGGATAVIPSSWPAAAGYQMVPTLYAADAATAAAAGGFYNQTAFVPQLAVTQMPQVK